MDTQNGEEIGAINEHAKQGRRGRRKGMNKGKQITNDRNRKQYFRRSNKKGNERDRE